MEKKPKQINEVLATIDSQPVRRVSPLACPYCLGINSVYVAAATPPAARGWCFLSSWGSAALAFRGGCVRRAVTPGVDPTELRGGRRNASCSPSTRSPASTAALCLQAPGGSCTPKRRPAHAARHAPALWWRLRAAWLLAGPRPRPGQADGRPDPHHHRGAERPRYRRARAERSDLPCPGRLFATRPMLTRTPPRAQSRQPCRGSHQTSRIDWIGCRIGVVETRANEFTSSPAAAQVAILEIGRKGPVERTVAG